MVYLYGLVLCAICPVAAPIIIPIFILLAVLQLVCGTIQPTAMASARRRLRERLTVEVMERRRIEARINERSTFLRAMYAYARPPGAAIIEPMRLTDQQRASIVGRVIAYAIDVVLAVVICGLMR
jgi:hypothetical protein